MKNKILTLDEVQDRNIHGWCYTNNIYRYHINGIEHLIINGIDVLEGKNAVTSRYYDAHAYSYQLHDNTWYLIINGIDVLPVGSTDLDVYEYSGNLMYKYKRPDGIYCFMVDDIDLLRNKGAVGFYYHGIIMGGILVYEYELQDGSLHRMRIKD